MSGLLYSDAKHTFAYQCARLAVLGAAEPYKTDMHVDGWNLPKGAIDEPAKSESPIQEGIDATVAPRRCFIARNLYVICR